MAIAPISLANSVLLGFEQVATSRFMCSAQAPPEEYATDSSCTMRLTAYAGNSTVGTTTTTIQQPGTWPTGTLSISPAQSFDNVVIHYEQPPVTGGDYGPIFMVDNLVVTPVPEPEKTPVVLLLASLVTGVICNNCRRQHQPS